MQSKQIPDAKVQFRFEMRRPPLEANARLAPPGCSRRRRLRGAAIAIATGGGTDAAFAALKTTGPGTHVLAVSRRTDQKLS